MPSLIVYPKQHVQSPAEMDPAGLIHLFSHTYSYILNKEGIGREEFGKEWGEDKEGEK